MIMGVSAFWIVKDEATNGNAKTTDIKKIDIIYLHADVTEESIAAADGCEFSNGSNKMIRKYGNHQ
jgi:hypothetical protein